MTNWGFLGSFAIAFVLSGFNEGNLLSGLFGFILLGIAFGAHVIVNHIFGTRFSKGEAALGLVAYVVSVLSFVVSWIVLPGFGGVNVAIGLSGFCLLFLCFLFYMVANHGLRGSFDMFDQIRRL